MGAVCRVVLEYGDGGGHEGSLIEKAIVLWPCREHGACPGV